MAPRQAAAQYTRRRNPLYTHKLGYDANVTQVCHSDVAGGRAQAQGNGSSKRSTLPVGWERWAFTVEERLRALSRSIPETPSLSIATVMRSMPQARVEERKEERDGTHRARGASDARRRQHASRRGTRCIKLDDGVVE